MQQRCAVANCFFDIDHGREWLVVDAEQFERVFRLIATFGNDADDWFPDVAHLAARQREDRRSEIIRHARGGDQGLYFGQIFGRDYRDDTRRNTRGIAIDCADPRVRLIAAAEGYVQYASGLPVVGVAAEPGEKTRVLGAFNACADNFWPGVDFGGISHRRPRLCANFATARRRGRTTPSLPASE